MKKTNVLSLLASRSPKVFGTAFLALIAFLFVGLQNVQAQNFSSSADSPLLKNATYQNANFMAKDAAVGALKLNINTMLDQSGIDTGSNEFVKSMTVDFQTKVLDLVVEGTPVADALLQAFPSLAASQGRTTVPTLDAIQIAEATINVVSQ